MTWIKLERHECDREPDTWRFGLEDAGTIIKCSVCGKMKRLTVVYEYDEFNGYMDWVDV